MKEGKQITRSPRNLGWLSDGVYRRRGSLAADASSGRFSSNYRLTSRGSRGATPHARTDRRSCRTGRPRTQPPARSVPKGPVASGLDE